MSVLHRHERGECGYFWQTKMMLDRQRFCPKCDHDTHADLLADGGKAEAAFGDRFSEIMELNRAGFISDEEAERVLFGEPEQKEEEMQPKYPIRLKLYRDTNPYEDTYHDAYIYEDMIVVDEETSEHAPGDRYGLSHKVEGLDFKAFKRAIGVEGAEIANAVVHEFSGRSGVSKFKSFCEAHGVTIRTYLSR